MLCALATPLLSRGGVRSKAMNLRLARPMGVQRLIAGRAAQEGTLIGTSLGVWRIAPACQRDAVSDSAHLGELYSGQR